LLGDEEAVSAIGVNGATAILLARSDPPVGVTRLIEILEAGPVQESRHSRPADPLRERKNAGARDQDNPDDARGPKIHGAPSYRLAPAEITTAQRGKEARPTRFERA
jgi:hypothetical protein